MLSLPHHSQCVILVALSVVLFESVPSVHVDEIVGLRTSAASLDESRVSDVSAELKRQSLLDDAVVVDLIVLVDLVAR